MTDFGKILDDWDSLRGRSSDVPSDTGSGSTVKGQDDFASMMESYLPDKRDVRGKESRQSGSDGKYRTNPASWPVDGRIDLHGMTWNQAEAALEHFLSMALGNGWKKVLIVHGKGNHSSGTPVLKGRVQKMLDSHPRTGRRGVPGREEGGSGALWVVIR